MTAAPERIRVSPVFHRTVLGAALVLFTPMLVFSGWAAAAWGEYQVACGEVSGVPPACGPHADALGWLLFLPAVLVLGVVVVEYRRRSRSRTLASTLVLSALLVTSVLAQNVVQFALAPTL